MKDACNVKNRKSSQISLGRKSLYSLIIFVAFVTILEVILRTTHLFGAAVSCTRPDPLLGWRRAPGAKYWFVGENDHAITGRINRFGWRDKEWSLEKPPGTYRIAVLGDSYVESLQVEPERTFLALAEQKLNNNGMKVEVMNFGRAGFSQTEEFLVVRGELTQFSPDMVVVFFLPPSDIREMSRETAHFFLRPFCSVSQNGEVTFDTSFAETGEFRTRRLLAWIRRHSALLSIIGQKYTTFRAAGRARTIGVSRILTAENPPTELKGCLSLCTDNPDDIYQTNYRLSKDIIKAMADHCREEAIRLVLVLPDMPTYLPQVKKRCRAADPTFDPDFFENDLAEFVHALDVEFIGFQKLFRKVFEDTGKYLHWGNWQRWGHWNYEGHRTVADVLSERIEHIINPTQEEFK